MMKNTVNPIVQGHKPIEGSTPSGSKALVCPKCSSFYISEKNCEGCGLIFDRPRTHFFKDRDNFFNLRNDYLDNLPFGIKSFPILEARKSNWAHEYKRKLLKRLKIICGALSEDGQRLLFQINQDGPFLKLEFTEILKELVLYRVDIESVQKVVANWQYQDVVGLWIKNQIKETFISHVINVRQSNDLRYDSFDFYKVSIRENIKRLFYSNNSVTSISERKIIMFTILLIPFISAVYFLFYFMIKNRLN